MSAELEKLRDSMREIDQMSQTTAAQVNALCRAAIARLACSPSALLDVKEILATIGSLLDDSENFISCECENRSAGFVSRNTERQALEDRFRAEAAAEAALNTERSKFAEIFRDQAANGGAR